MKRILHIEHHWAGGLARHVKDLASFLEADGIESLRCRPSKTFWLDIEAVNGTNARSPTRLIPSDIEQCVAAIQELNIVHAHFHSIIDYSPFVVEQLVRAFQKAGVQFDFTVHDYAAICPRVHMVDHGQVFCDVASLHYCDRCVSSAGTPFGDVDPKAWRARYMQLLEGARSIFVPNVDVAERIRAYLGNELRLKVKPHPEPLSHISHQSVRPLPGAARPRRVAIVGRLSDIKGLHVVRAMALDAGRRTLPLRFVIFGQPDSHDLEAFPNVEVKGPFEEEDIDELIQNALVDIAFFPSVCPETHLYTLSIALRNMIFPVVFDIGSQAERVRRARFGAVLPLDMALKPGLLNDRLAATDIPLMSSHEVDARRPIAAWTSARDYYELSGL